MDVAVAPSHLFYSFPTPALSSSSSSFSIPIPIAALAHKHRHVQAIRPTRTSVPTAISSSPIATTTMDSEIELEDRKFELLSAINDTKRGLATTPDQRSSIEEALVRVESFNAGEPIKLDMLDGTWRLQYTSASDVLILFQSAETLPFLQVGQIFQKFECRDKNGHGIVRNVVRWSIPNFLEEHEGATLLVSAKFSVVSARNIYLEFEEIAIQNLKISEELQALIAPALLPRTFLSLQILQFIKAYRVQVPVASPQRRSVGGLYYLSYLDSNMLLGRAVGGGGVFIFTRAHASI
ncbi:putative plastid-lipid-associated protein 10 [Forsythia ovata]|uniref:Plastid-lipid-associated protein 10 n=1 Tax=Forsythia ovata TaxID=205694 RepID=A0ABD1RGV1_9LAMI